MTFPSDDRGAPRLSRTISDGMASLSRTQTREGGDSSDDDLNREIEVMFDNETIRRRKSSIVAAESSPATFDASGRPTDRPHPINENRHTKSSCLVHKLVEKTTLGQQPMVEDKFFAPEGGSNSGGGSGAETSGGNNRLEKIDEGDMLRTTQTQSSVASSSASNGGSTTTTGMESEIGAMQSRLLTKRQLSDMAMSVRALAKRLSSLKVKLQIRRVFLLTKAYDKTLIAKTREVARWLLSKERDVEYVVYVENTMRENGVFDAEGLLREGDEEGGKGWRGRLKYWDNELARTRPHTFDFVVTLGGDGTVLYASWLFQRVVPPVLSFALGSLGFLTKFDFENYQHTLTQAFRDGVTISLRLRFEGTIMRSQRRVEDCDDADLVEELMLEEADGKPTHKPDRTFEILNDIVVDRGPNPTMSTIELFGDEEHLTTVQADGVCVATPTGSTAYNLAAGGSLCHPENPVILVTAICAHTLSFRPIILPDTIVLRLGVPYDARANSWASFDGRERVELRPGDYVTISASRYPFANVMPPGRRSEDWVNSISRTLQWNSRQRQKAFQEWDGGSGKKKSNDEEE